MPAHLSNQKLCQLSLRRPLKTSVNQGFFGEGECFVSYSKSLIESFLRIKDEVFDCFIKNK
jgi:hypothetical protein